MSVQVDSGHYRFDQYYDHGRWASVWYQLRILSQLHISTVLEIGPGVGIFKSVAKTLGHEVISVDHDIALQPDAVSLAHRLPFPDSSFEAVCAFQVLEHMPYTISVQAVGEMARVAKKYLVISLPNADRRWPYSLYIPRFGEVRFTIPRPRLRSGQHTFDGQHYWELNKRGYDERKVFSDFGAHANLIDEFRVKENPYHHFLVFEK